MPGRGGRKGTTSSGVGAGAGAGASLAGSGGGSTTSSHTTADAGPSQQPSATAVTYAYEQSVKRGEQPKPPPGALNVDPIASIMDVLGVGGSGSNGNHARAATDALDAHSDDDDDNDDGDEDDDEHDAAHDQAAGASSSTARGKAKAAGARKGGSKTSSGPASAAARKAANRLAQREFRQRKQQYIRALELRVDLLSANHDTQVDRLRWCLHQLIAENNQLRGVVSSLASFIGNGFIGGVLANAGISRQQLADMMGKPSEQVLQENMYKLPNAFLSSDVLTQIRKDANIPPEGLPESVPRFSGRTQPQTASDQATASASSDSRKRKPSDGDDRGMVLPRHDSADQPTAIDEEGHAAPADAPSKRARTQTTLGVSGSAPSPSSSAAAPYGPGYLRGSASLRNSLGIIPGTGGSHTGSPANTSMTASPFNAMATPISAATPSSASSPAQALVSQPQPLPSAAVFSASSDTGAAPTTASTVTMPIGSNMNNSLFGINTDTQAAVNGGASAADTFLAGLIGVPLSGTRAFGFGNQFVFSPQQGNLMGLPITTAAPVTSTANSGMSSTVAIYPSSTAAAPTTSYNPATSSMNDFLSAYGIGIGASTGLTPFLTAPSPGLSVNGAPPGQVSFGGAFDVNGSADGPNASNASRPQGQSVVEALLSDSPWAVPALPAGGALGSASNQPSQDVSQKRPSSKCSSAPSPLTGSKPPTPSSAPAAVRSVPRAASVTSGLASSPRNGLNEPKKSQSETNISALDPAASSTEAREAAYRNSKRRVSLIVGRLNRYRARLGRTDFLPSPTPLSIQDPEVQLQMAKERTEALVKEQRRVDRERRKAEKGDSSKRAGHVAASDGDTSSDSDDSIPPSLPLEGDSLDSVYDLNLQLAYHMDNYARNPSYKLPPLLALTEEQRAIPHDTLLDNFPVPSLRAAMIRHAGEFDLEEAFFWFLEAFRLHPGDALNESMWEIDAPFFMRYPFLADQRLMDRTNRYRQERGQPIVPMSEIERRLKRWEARRARRKARESSGPSASTSGSTSRSGPGVAGSALSGAPGGVGTDGKTGATVPPLLS